MPTVNVVSNQFAKKNQDNRLSTTSLKAQNNIQIINAHLIRDSLSLTGTNVYDQWLSCNYFSAKNTGYMVM